MNDSIHTGEKGILYVVATPIGNRQDITLRALDILDKVDLIAAEDTRKSGKFLARHRIKNHLISYHEHNEKKRTPELIKKLLGGTSIALISNAGTPSVSDPGFRLITSATGNGIIVTPVPGVNAAITAISVSGLATDSFTFVGFAPKKKGKRIHFLSGLADQPATVIFYESPKRIIALIQDIVACMGDREAMLAREMTKRHEEFIRGTLSQILEIIKARPVVKGECTLLVARGEQINNLHADDLENRLKEALQNETGSLSEIARTIAKNHGLPKKTVYDLALKIKGMRTED